jgi:hypothetical protein
MPTVHQELNSFLEFVKVRISMQEPTPSLEDCMRMWREEQELAETIAAIKRGEENFAAGRCMTLEEAEQRLRAELMAAEKV